MVAFSCTPPPVQKVVEPDALIEAVGTLLTDTEVADEVVLHPLRVTVTV